MNELSEKFENMKKSQEYKIFKRLEMLNFTWHLCKVNEKELFDLINLLEKSINIELAALQLYDDAIALLTRRLINHVSTVFLLVDHMRNENKFLIKNNNGIIDYQNKVNEHFTCNPNIQFVQGLRNYVIHSKMIKLETESYIINDELSNSILILETDILLESDHWNKYAKKYILQNKPKIDIKSCLMDYSNLQEQFFLWFLTEYKKKYEKEITYCENVFNNWNNFMDNKRKEFEKMSFNELLSLPQLICDSENGFTITKKE